MIDLLHYNLKPELHLVGGIRSGVIVGGAPRFRIPNSAFLILVLFPTKGRKK